ncbi:hypothetical protein VTI74DRAFT_5360 [Chaetomium olivicolor]
MAPSSGTGRFNDLIASADLNKWSWFNQGAKLTLDSTAFWNSQTMRRTELIPQTKAAINMGKVYYHFSMMRKDTNAPSVNREHQICFFESHFTEMKYGWISGEAGTGNPNLQWMTNQQSQWKTEWKAGVWHNIAYEIDFSANKVGFWHSEGAEPLTQVVAPVSVSTSSNGAGWHLDVLELPRSGYPDTNEEFYFSGVYVEDGAITTRLAGLGMGYKFMGRRPWERSTVSVDLDTQKFSSFTKVLSSQTTTRVNSCGG